jgi:hypothetical protein
MERCFIVLFFGNVNQFWCVSGRALPACSGRAIVSPTGMGYGFVCLTGCVWVFGWYRLILADIWASHKPGRMFRDEFVCRCVWEWFAVFG